MLFFYYRSSNYEYPIGLYRYLSYSMADRDSKSRNRLRLILYSFISLYTFKCTKILTSKKILLISLFYIYVYSFITTIFLMNRSLRSLYLITLWVIGMGATVLHLGSGRWSRSNTHFLNSGSIPMHTQGINRHTR